MKKFIFAFLIIISFSACGVDTASSSKEADVIITDEPKVVIPADSDLVVFDSIDSNPVVTVPVVTVPDDLNGTDPDTVIPDVPSVNPSTSEFDTVGAIADPNACLVSYNFVSDASYGGELDAENGAASAIAEKNDEPQGLVIRSEYLSQNYEDTWVSLYYRNAPSTSSLDQGVAGYTMDGVFHIDYDLAWFYESASGTVDNVVYVKSEKTLKPSCYRLTLNSVVGSEIDVQKVYRVRL